MPKSRTRKPKKTNRSNAAVDRRPVVIRAGRERNAPETVPSACLPNGAIWDTTLSLEARAMLTLMRTYQSEGEEFDPEAAAVIQRCDENEARRLADEVRASGWLDVKGCAMCPAGHLCARTDEGPVSTLHRGLLRHAADATSPVAAFEAIAALKITEPTMQIEAIAATLQLVDLGLARIAVEADGANPYRYEITDAGRTELG